jgi:YhcH/YjgK/YiaL family protein
MIIDTIKNYETYISIHPLFKRGFEYLLNTDFNNLADGRHEIEGDKLFALMQTYDTKSESELRYEAHKKYIDIQFMISGNESFFHADTSYCDIIEMYSDETDVAFYKADGILYQVLEKQFYILFPQDAHKPCMHYNNKVQSVKKVVLKVLI